MVPMAAVMGRFGAAVAAVAARRPPSQTSLRRQPPRNVCLGFAVRKRTPRIPSPRCPCVVRRRDVCDATGTEVCIRSSASGQNGNVSACAISITLSRATKKTMCHRAATFHRRKKASMKKATLAPKRATPPNRARCSSVRTRRRGSGELCSSVRTCLSGPGERCSSVRARRSGPGERCSSVRT